MSQAAPCSSWPAGGSDRRPSRPDGRETIFAFVEAGELFGELAVLDDQPRREFAEAVEASLVLAVPREDLVWLMGRRPDVALSVTKLWPAPAGSRIDWEYALPIDSRASCRFAHRAFGNTW